MKNIIDKNYRCINSACI